MPAASDPSARKPRPRLVFAEDCDDPDFDLLLVYAVKTARWIVDDIMQNPTLDPKIAEARAREARNLNELVRAIERLDRVQKRRAGQPGKSAPDDVAETLRGIARKVDSIAAAEEARATAQGTDAE